jgi:UPF0716 family protein affecting phage T7 exclusion
MFRESLRPAIRRVINKKGTKNRKNQKRKNNKKKNKNKKIDSKSQNMQKRQQNTAEERPVLADKTNVYLRSPESMAQN